MSRLPCAPADALLWSITSRGGLGNRAAVGPSKAIAWPVVSAQPSPLAERGCPGCRTNLLESGPLRFGEAHGVRQPGCMAACAISEHPSLHRLSCCSSWHSTWWLLRYDKLQLQCASRFACPTRQSVWGMGRCTASQPHGKVMPRSRVGRCGNAARRYRVHGVRMLICRSGLSCCSRRGPTCRCSGLEAAGCKACHAAPGKAKSPSAQGCKLLAARHQGR